MGTYLEQMFVREDGNQYYVYKKGDNGKLKKQYVEVGKNVSGSLEIVSGLSLDDEIAFPYGRDVREGAKTKSTDDMYRQTVRGDFYAGRYQTCVSGNLEPTN